ncbi:hypothetical protein [Paenibacillus glucanolyticus]|uniref:hypothetical protein n=1 Tax=Paenibacillus glucanolyticus TaxID=59843 RepID=UPI0030CCDFC6
MEKITLLGGCLVKLKGIIAVLIIAVMILSACGKGKTDYHESLLTGIDMYLHDIENKTEGDIETDIKFVKGLLAQYEGEDKEQFAKIAELMEEGNSSEVKKLYEELEKK